jgi:hypothetical protein
MTYAKIAADCINLMCIEMFKDNAPRSPVQMASTMANGEVIDAFDHQGGGTWKYIPADKLTLDLNERPGAGVYSYWHMKDGSYLLRTCHGALAHWSGKAEDKAEWGINSK